jgi:hypothetical protein
MASWKGRLLNKAGRLVLATAVINSIPSYGMQIQWYPQSVCDYLDKVAGRFVLKGSENKCIWLVGIK